METALVLFVAVWVAVAVLVSLVLGRAIRLADERASAAAGETVVTTAALHGAR